MAQQVRTRHQVTVPYSANNMVPKDLGRGMIYREIYIRLQGKITCTAANNTQANTAKGDEWGAAKFITIRANGQDVLRRISGEALWWLNHFLYQGKPAITPTLGDGATADPSFDSVLILPFWMPRSLRPIDTALDARVLSGLTVEIDWGDYTSVNSAATAWTTEPTVEVGSLESFGVHGTAFSQWRIWPITQTINATSSDLLVPLPVGPIYRGFLINTTDGGVDSGSILNEMKLVSGTTVFADQKATVLQQVPRMRYGLQREVTSGAYEADRRSSDSKVEGWYYYDHVTDGYNSEGIDTLGFSEINLDLDVTLGGGTTGLTVYPMAIYPVRGAHGKAQRAA